MKKVVVKGIPNIRLTREVKGKIEAAVKGYIAKKCPFPSHNEVRAWLEKVGNEAYPEEHRELLGPDGYNICDEKIISGWLTEKPNGDVIFKCGDFSSRFSFKILVFEVRSAGYPNENFTHVMKYINRRIKEDPEKIVLNYCREVTEREEEAAGLKEVLLSSLFWAEYSQELPEEVQKLVKTLIVENYTESCRAFEKFKEKVHD